MFGVVQLNTGLNDMVTCPYNPAHRVKFSRFAKHFLQCQRQHPNDTRKQCPYNYTELVEPDQFTKHISECPFQYLYGTRNADRNSNNTKIQAPCDVEFGQEVDVPKRSDFDFDSDDDIDSVSVIAEERRHRHDPDDIDSVSVIAAERRRRCQDLGKSSLSSSLSSMINAPPVNVGRGRAAFIKSLLNKDKISSSGDEVETSPSTTEEIGYYRESGSFSFICNKNIRGEKPKPFGSDTSYTNSGSAPNADSIPKSQFLKELRDCLRNPGMDEELLKKMGRGRGQLFR